MRLGTFPNNIPFYELIGIHSDTFDPVDIADLLSWLIFLLLIYGCNYGSYFHTADDWSLYTHHNKMIRQSSQFDHILK